MVSLCDHEEYVRLNPTDKVAALTLVDHKQEDLGVSRLTALISVARIRRRSIQMAETARAARLIASEDGVSRNLNYAIQAITWSGSAQNVFIVLKDGRARPKWYPGGKWSGYEAEPMHVITVGSRFVLRLYQLMQLCKALGIGAEDQALVSLLAE